MARLPQPGSDEGAWGDILNTFLSQSHNADGTLKPNTVNSSSLADSAVSEAKLASGVQAKLNNVGTVADGSVTEVKLDSGVRAKLNNVGTLPDGSVTDAKLSPALKSTIDAKADTAALDGKANVSDLAAKADASALAAKADASALNAKADSASLAAVATSGDYSDLTGRPAIPAQFNPSAGTNVSLTGSYPNITISATPGAGVTDLKSTPAAGSVVIESSTGVDATIAAATGTMAGVMSASDKSRLENSAAAYDTQKVYRYSTTSGWPTPDSTDLFGRLFLSTNSATAPDPASVPAILALLKAGDEWERHPDAEDV